MRPIATGAHEPGRGSSAVRLMDGDTHRAEDVAQTVFADLARLARNLSKDVLLGGWLHRRTCHVAATILRGEHTNSETG